MQRGRLCEEPCQGFAAGRLSVDRARIFPAQSSAPTSTLVGLRCIWFQPTESDHSAGVGVEQEMTQVSSVSWS